MKDGYRVGVIARTNDRAKRKWQTKIQWKIIFIIWNNAKSFKWGLLTHNTSCVFHCKAALQLAITRTDILPLNWRTLFQNLARHHCVCVCVCAYKISLYSWLLFISSEGRIAQHKIVLLCNRHLNMEERQREKNTEIKWERQTDRQRIMVEMVERFCVRLPPKYNIVKWRQENCVELHWERSLANISCV